MVLFVTIEFTRNRRTWFLSLRAIDGLGFCLLAAALVAGIGRCSRGRRGGKSAWHDKGERKRPQDARVAIQLEHHER